MSLRRLPGILVACLVLSTGCLGFVTGNEPLAFEATPATVPDATLTEAGYQEESVEPQPVERQFTVAGQDRTVEVTNWLARYDRRLELGPLGEQELGVFVALSSPKVEVLGRTFNPIGDMSNRELLGQMQGRYEGLEIGERVGTKRLTVLGQETTVETFAGTASMGGIDVELRIRIATIEHEGDYVVAVGIFPARLPEDGERVDAMFEGLEHGG